MAKIKSYTDIEQSKTLAKILSLKSADMYYSHEFVNSAGDYYKLNIASEGYFDDKELLGSDIPAWSLAALLGVLPNENMLVKTTDGEYYCLAKDVMTKHYDNPIDACVAMIEKLHELKML